MTGLGGAPTRATTIPEDPAERKRHPVASGVLDYFPDALVEIARVSWEGNERHNPGTALHWDRSKSGDEADALMRHFLQRGTLDSDGMRHSAKLAWRALALLQKEIEAERAVEEKCCGLAEGPRNPDYHYDGPPPATQESPLCDAHGNYVGFTPQEKMAR